MNKLKEFKILNNKFFKYCFYLVLLLVLLLFTINMLNQYQKTSHLDESLIYFPSNFENCDLTPSSIINYYESKFSEINIYQSTKSLSIFPEIENLKCLGKVMEIKPISNSEINYVVGISPIFSKYIGNLTFISFFIFSLIFFKNLNFYAITFLTSTFLIATDNLLYLNQTIDKLTLKIFIIIFSIYLSKKTLTIKSVFKNEIKRINFRDDINILRAISVVSVLFYHAEFSLFRGGWLGVDIFLLSQVS